MPIYEILAQRFTEGTEKYNTLYTAIQAGINNGTLSDRDVLKSPDSVINNLIRTIYSNKGDVVSGMILVNGVTYEGDGKRYAELGDGNTGGGSGTDTTALIDLLNNSINTTTNNLSGQIEGLRTETNNTFKDTINLSDMTSYHMLKGDINFSNEVIATAFNTVTYPGQATALSVDVGVDLTTQHGSTVNETHGGLLICKATNGARDPWFIDSLRGWNNVLASNKTDANGIYNGGISSVSGSTVNLNGNLGGLNIAGEAQVIHAFGTTHRKSATDGSPELVVNCDFSNGVTSWTNNGLLTMTVVNGIMTTTDNNTTDGNFYQDIPTTVGKLYTFKVDCLLSTGGTSQMAVDGSTPGVFDSTLTRFITNGKGVVTFRALKTTTRIAIFSNQTTTAMNIDNVSVKENTNPTNHDKWWECHYNQTTGYMQMAYEGSGRPRHELPNLLKRALSMEIHKNITSPSNFIINTGYFFNNTSGMGLIDLRHQAIYTEDVIRLLDGAGQHNTDTEMYVMYGWSDSYYDDNGKLIGNYELGAYTRSSNAIDTIPLKDNPCFILIKRADAGSDWIVVDLARYNFNSMYFLNSAAVAQGVAVAGREKGFAITGTGPNYGVPGATYCYLVVYGNDVVGSNKSKFSRQSTTPNLNLSGVVAPVPNGIGNRGLNTISVNKNETISTLPYLPGDNYLFANTSNGYIVSNVAPKYLFGVDTTVTIGDGVRGYEYDINKQKWINVITTSVNEKLKKDTLDFFGDGSCIATYRFDGDTNDLSGLYNGVNSNIKFENNGKFGKSGIFENNSSLVLASNPIPFTSKTITISNWMYGDFLQTSTPSGDNIGFGRKSANAAYNNLYWFRILGGVISYGQSNVSYYNLSITRNKSGWNHYATVLDGTNIHLYCNGVKELSYAIEATLMTALNTYVNLYGINEEVTASGARLVIDQCRIFNRALTSSEIKKLACSDSYTYQDALVSFLDTNIICNADSKVIGIKKLPKTNYIDKLIVNELEAVNSILANPVGTIIQHASTIVPKGYLKCSGYELSRSVYKKLFDVIGTTYGVGDGSTTFNIPDLRGEFIRGWDDGKGVDVGRSIGSWQKGSLVAANAPFNENFLHGVAAGTVVDTGQTCRSGLGYDDDLNFTTNYANTTTVAVAATTATSVDWMHAVGYGGGVTRPRNTAMMFCIKY